MFADSFSPRRAAIAMCALLAAAGCRDSAGPGDQGLDKPGISLVAGAGITDTIDAAQLQALVVQVRGSDGKLVSGTLVRFDAMPTEDSTRRFEPAIVVCVLSVPSCESYGNRSFATDTTDERGRAKVLIRLGRVAGRAVVKVTVPEFALVDSAIYTVTPGALHAVRASPRTLSLAIGGTATTVGKTVDRYGNARPEIANLTAGSGTALSISAAPGSAVLTGLQLGVQKVYVRHGSLVDSTIVTVVPTGRLVVWSNDLRVVRLINLDGTAVRTIASSVSSDNGAFPRFDATRQRVTLHAGTESYGGPSNRLLIVDTASTSQRVIGLPGGFTSIKVTRQLADASVLVVGMRAGDSGFLVYRVATNDAISPVALSSFFPTYGGADISPDGSRVAIANFELRVMLLSTGQVTPVATQASSPRWSPQGDRLAFVGSGGTAYVVNADGTGLRGLGPTRFSPGLTWSPDGTYLLGRVADYYSSGGLMQLIRVSDAVSVSVRFAVDYFQPDWR